MGRAAFLFRAAAASLLFLPLRSACQYEDVVRQVTQPNYTHYLNELLFARAGDSRGPTSPQHEAARTNIRDTLAAFGLNATLDRFAEYDGRVFYNVTAVLPGKTRPDEYHVLGAHYDSVSNPGADDDASGVAALLEAARVASLHDFEASLVFVAFDLEEVGFFGPVGSGAWVAAHTGDRILSMLNMDMIGYNTPGVNHNQVAVCASGLSPNLTVAGVQAAIVQYSGGLTSMTSGTAADALCLRAALSDQFSFGALTPSALIIEAGFFENGSYHGAADSVDTPNYIDYEFASAVTRAVVGYMARQAGLLPDDSAAARLNPGGVYNSASFIVGSVAPAELITLIGSGFGEKPSVAVRDSAGEEQTASVMYSSPRQINVLLPASLAPGTATIILTREDGLRLAAALKVESVAPGVFTAESSGLGAPAAEAVRVAPDGGQTVQNLFECVAAPIGCAPVPVDFGADGDQVVLVLYGTGIRGRGDLKNVSLEVDGQKLAVQYAGAQPGYPGLDQVNIELPRALRGQGRISATLRVDGKAANPVVVDLGKP